MTVLSLDKTEVSRAPPRLYLLTKYTVTFTVEIVEFTLRGRAQII